nr:hypothetical protein [Tanacetum cinerariifolium]
KKRREKSVSGMEDKCESYVKVIRYAAEPAYLATLYSIKFSDQLFLLPLMCLYIANYVSIEVRLERPCDGAGHRQLMQEHDTTRWMRFRKMA